MERFNGEKKNLGGFVERKRVERWVDSDLPAPMTTRSAVSVESAIFISPY